MIMKHKRLYNVIKFILIFLIQMYVFLCPVRGEDTGADYKYRLKDNYNDYIQVLYNNSNGLTGGKANAVAQTENGIIWIGTYGGLYEFDGLDFVHRKDFSSVRSVNCLYVDDSDRLFIGTNDEGLSLMIDDRIIAILSEQDGLPSDSVRCVCQGTDGYYYVGTSAGLAVFKFEDNGSGIEPSVVKIIDDAEYVIDIDCSNDSLVSCVTNAGELYIIKGTEIIGKKVLDFGEQNYSACCFDDDGILHVGTSGGGMYDYTVDRLSGEISRYFRYRHISNFSSISVLRYMADGHLFICADNGAGYMREDGSFYKIKLNTFASSIEDFIVDYQGNLWVASARKGVMKFCKSSFVELFSGLGLEEEVVNSVIKWRGKFYFGTDNGLVIADIDKNILIENDYINKFSGMRIRDFLVDSSNNLWIATANAGIKEITDKGEIKTYTKADGASGERFRGLLELSDGTVAVAGDTGITFIKNDEVTGIFGTEDGLSNPKVLDMIERSDGSIWAGTDGGGISVIKDGKISEVIKRSEGLGSNVVMKLVELEEGLFIQGSNSLSFIANNENVRIIDDIPYYNNYDVIYDGMGKLWLTGAAGVYIFDKADLITGNCTNYAFLGERTGLQGCFIANSNYYIDSDGSLYLPTDRGCSKINVNNYLDYDNDYRFNIRSIYIDGEKIQPENNGKIIVPAGALKIEVVPRIANYSALEPDITYQLEGYDKNEIYSSQLQLEKILYTNIPPGSYSLNIKIKNPNDGEVLENFSFELEKMAFFYQERWFRLTVVFICALIIIIITSSIARFRMRRRMEAQNKELEAVKKQMGMVNETILAIAKTVDAKDENTSQHSQRVAEYSVDIARKLGMNEEEVYNLKRMALLHDIGKIAIPDAVLNKPDRLTDEEYLLMKSHVSRGAEILKDFTLVENVTDGVLYHHERYDGKGYVCGLKGDEIPLTARIIAIADAFDAMTANRVYRKRLTMPVVVDELKRCRGTQFDPLITDIMLGLIEEGVINPYSVNGGKDEEV